MAKQSSIQLMTKGSIAKQIIGYAIPIFIGYLFQQLYNTVDALIVGNFLGQNALAAVTSVGSLIFLFVGFFNGFATGASVIIANAIGAQDEERTKKAVYTTATFGILLGLIMTGVGYLLTDQMLMWMGSPQEVFGLSSTYLKIYFLGGFSLVLYNMLVGIIRAGGDAKHPLYYLIVSSILNVILDVVFITVFKMGVAGAAWATILSQFLSALFSLLVGLKNFPVLHLRREDFHDISGTISLHLKTGFPMGFQMSVMCIGQLAMQTVVNSLGTAAVAGYTAASKADQLSVLVNNAMMTAISNYVAQNFGAGKRERIRQGVRACLIQTETFNLIMCIGILLLRHPIVQMFLSDPTKEIYHYSDMYLTIVAPFYFILGLLAVYRTSIQSMQNGRAPFAACMIELVMRIAATVGLSGMIGYTSVCIASPLAWIGACSLLIPVYYKMMRRI